MCVCVYIQSNEVFSSLSVCEAWLSHCTAEADYQKNAATADSSSEADNEAFLFKKLNDKVKDKNP